MTTAAERHAVEVDRRSRCAARALMAKTHERTERLEERHGTLTADQVRDLLILEDLDHDLLTGRPAAAWRYGLVAG